jgi:signal transduction histidine kinase
VNGISLRLRLAAAGAVAIALALAVAGYGLTLLFERHVYRTLADTLDAYVREIAGGLEIDAGGTVSLPRAPSDPGFYAPLSGLYWEIVGDARTLRSRSLWDADLNLPSGDLSEGETHHHQIVGPDGKLLLVAERRIQPARGPKDGLRIIVGSDLTRLKAARDAFATELVPSLALLAIVLGAATLVQLGLGLRPLKVLRDEVSAIATGRRRRLADQAPLEVRPLVAEVNALLDARDAELERARGRAADLAHGLKTPLAALAGDAFQLRELGHLEIADSIEAVSKAMRRHVERELARARVQGAARSGSGATPIGPVVDALFRTLARTDQGSALNLVNATPAEATVPIERSDLTEALGNLLDNGVRYAVSTVRVTCVRDGEGWTIAVEDDGSGIAPETEKLIRKRGGRLDLTGGAGLGLAIVDDILDAYRWSMSLDRSDLGGLRIVIAPQAKADERSLP